MSKVTDMMKVIKMIIVLAVVCMSLQGCKPTENNYKAAYDAAVSKRKAEDKDPDIYLPSGVLQRVGEPTKKNIQGKEYSYQFMRLNPLDDKVKLEPYNVVVAVYNMPTNCESQVSDLKAEGYSASGAKSAEDRYYVIAGSFLTEEGAAEFIDNYTGRHKDAVYVGFREGPVIIRIR